MTRSFISFLPALLLPASLCLPGLTRAQGDGQSLETRVAVGYGLGLAATVIPIMAGLRLATRDNPNLGVPLILAGGLVGPSLGQFYNFSFAQGGLGMGIRATGGFALLVSLVESLKGLSCIDSDPDRPETCQEPDPKVVSGFAAAGTALIAGGALYSFVDTYFSAKRRVTRLSLSKIGWSPILTPDPTGSFQVGAAAWRRF